MRTTTLASYTGVMLPAIVAIGIAVVLAGQSGPPLNAETEAWLRAHPQAMTVFRSWNEDSVSCTPAFRACVDTNLRAGQPPSVINGCLLEAKRAQADEMARGAVEQRRAREEEAQRVAQKESEQRQAREAEETARAKEEAEASHRDYEENRPEAIKKWMGAVLGYRVALAEDRRAEAKTEIAKEKKYSHVGGVVNKSAIYEAQQKIRWADEDIEERKQTAKDEGVKILSRNDKRVATVEECLDSSYDHERSGSITETDIDRIARGTNSFVVEGQDCLWIVLLIKETEPR